MSLENIMKSGYILLVVTLLLMIWASMTQGREMEQIKYPPCSFNPLCTCSKAAPDLGVVQCKNVPFPAIPKTVNQSKVFMLQMENTGLRTLDSYFLQATGLYRLEISYNPIANIPDEAFVGLDRSLWDLYLYHNQLVEIPARALRRLQKLRLLDLSDNKISCIEQDSFRGLEDSLQSLILSENSLNILPKDAFSSLVLLETLDLRGNNLAEIDSTVFRDGMPRLVRLFLSDNWLTDIPYSQVAPLKSLRTLDLSHNVIYSMRPNGSDEPKGIKLTLDNLHLEYNEIENIETNAFQYFDVVNRTYLDGNNFQMVYDQAFRPAKIRELYMRHCQMHHISPKAFDGLGPSLQVLDLSGNNITNIHEHLFNNFDYLRVLNLKDNRIKMIEPTEMFNGFQYTLLKLDLSGEKNAATNLQDLRRCESVNIYDQTSNDSQKCGPFSMRNLRSLAVTQLTSTQLGPDDFIEYGVELEDLKITRGKLQTIKSHAFMHVRGIKRLDLSENQISSIEKDSFNEIGHSLISLKISHGFASSMNSVPSDALRHLTSLQELDFSNNQIKTMTDTSFHFLRNLRILELHDNHIDKVMKGTFQGDIHSKLEEISISFNELKTIAQHTFVDLEALHKLRLEDNRIDKLERRAFMNLDQLRYLSLRGNKMNSISDEAFQVIP